MWKKVAKVLAGLPFLVATGIFIVYLLFGYFAVDPLAKRILPWVAENKLASKASVGKVSFDPLRLSVTVEKFRLTQRNGALLAGFEHLFADLEISGLLHFAWRLQDIRVTAPEANVEIAPDGKLNWATLLAKINEDKTPSKELPRLLIDHIQIIRGDIQYLDRNRPVAFKAVLEPLNLELDGLSTLPQDSSDYMITARLPEQGGTLKWKGDLGLNPVVSNGSFALEGVKLARLLHIVEQADLPFHTTSGDISAQSAYHFAIVKDQPQGNLQNLSLNLTDLSGSLTSSGKMALGQLNIRLPKLEFVLQSKPQVKFSGLELGVKALSLNSADKNLFSLPQAKLNGVDFDLAAHQAKVKSITLTGGELHAVRDRTGNLDWQRTFSNTSATLTPQPAPATTSQSEQSFEIEVADIQLQHWQADLRDQSFRYPLALDIADINLGFSLSQAGDNLVISAMNSATGPITVKSALFKQPAATLAKVNVEGGEIKLADKSVDLQAVIVSGLRTQLTRESGKPLNWQALLEPAASTSKSSSSKSKNHSAEKSDWSLALHRFAVEDAGLHVEDRTSIKEAKSPVVLDIQKAMLEANDISLDMTRPLPLKAAFQVKQGGQFHASGKLALTPLQGDLTLKLANLALKPFSPYINQLALLKLNDGNFNSSGKLKLNFKKSNSLAYKGSFAVNKLVIHEETGNAPFLAWQQLASDRLDVGLAPNRVHMAELRIIKPNAKFIINPDKSLNIQRILRNQPVAATPTPVSATAPASTSEQTTQIAETVAEPPTPTQETPALDALSKAKLEAEKPAAEKSVAANPAFPIVIDRLRIDQAELEFADLSLSPQFGTHINSLSGVVNGLSNKETTTAQVELDGKVDDYGSARIRGSIQPFRATNFTDLKLSFKNLEMNRITPYSGKFAGRHIDSGKLSVDLEYKIKNRQLAGENKFIINKLKLGKKVDSPDATSLPLDLAIALLEDSDGVIDLDLPVSGSLDDPKFSYGSLIWKAITNVLKKIVTAPFRALGKLLGVSSDKLEAIAFDAGSPEIAPPEQEKLKSVSEILKKRPALTLAIAPVYDGTADARALQEFSIRRDVAQQMGVKLEPGQQAGPVDLTNADVQDALEDLGDERIKKEDLKKIEKGAENAKEDKQALYQALLEKLTTLTPVTETELQKLATSRAEAMQKFMLEAGVPTDRISLGTLEQLKSNAETVNAKLSLGTKSQ